MHSPQDFLALEAMEKDGVVLAIKNARKLFVVCLQTVVLSQADSSGKLWGLRQHRDKARAEQDR